MHEVGLWTSVVFGVAMEVWVWLDDFVTDGAGDHRKCLSLMNLEWKLINCFIFSFIRDMSKLG